MRRALLALSLLPLVGCPQLDKPTVSCARADDCRAPLVCCTGGYYLMLNDFTGPTCGPRWECPGDFMPFLPAGAPCARAPAVPGETCKAGLVCCASTLTCAAAEDCAAAPAPTSVDPASPLSCYADSDCSDGQVCCGIDFDSRDGTCRGLAACAALQGVQVPQPDAGGMSMADGGTASLGPQICDALYCDASGPRAPATDERELCLQAFTSGALLATSACLEAVQASRSYCEHALRPRGTAARGALPVVPAACRLDPVPEDPDAVAACAVLASCGELGTTTPEACARHLAGLGYDSLSRIAQVVGCRVPSARLGVAPSLSPATRCRVDADCPNTYACRAQETSSGICVKPCRSDNDCGANAACLNRGCYAECPPLEDNNRALVEAACGARIVLDGPPELACVPTTGVGGALHGACVPVPRADQCTNGSDPVFASNGGRTLGYACATSTVGETPRHHPCTTTNGSDECAHSACLPYFGNVCSDPCVASPFAPPCPNGELCMAPDRGWGIVGVCLPPCVNGACAAGLTCRDYGTLGRACAP